MNNMILKENAALECESIVIIMSVYNGGKYIIEQIESILSQESVSVKIWIRDDGSTDGTFDLVAEKYSGDDRVHIVSGKNLGACGSFIEATFSCELKADYYGFSDADDVWVSDKLKHSVQCLKESADGAPLAVSTRLEVVNESLGFMGYTNSPRRGLSFENAIVETVASGASVLMNKTAFDLVRQKRPSHAVMHDAWIYLVITAFGKFIYSDYPTIKYRQHGSNVYGASRTLKKRLAARLSRLVKGNPFRLQAMEFLRFYGADLDEKKLQTISRYCNYPRNFAARLAFSVFPSVRYQSPKANLFMRVLSLFGKV